MGAALFQRNAPLPSADAPMPAAWDAPDGGRRFRRPDLPTGSLPIGAVSHPNPLRDEPPAADPGPPDIDPPS